MAYFQGLGGAIGAPHGSEYHGQVYGRCLDRKIANDLLREPGAL